MSQKMVVSFLTVWWILSEMDSEDFLVFHSSMIGKCLFLISEENSLIVTVIIPYNDHYVIKEEQKWIIFSINHHSLLIMSPNNSYCSPHVSFYLFNSLFFKWITKYTRIYSYHSITYNGFKSNKQMNPQLEHKLWFIIYSSILYSVFHVLWNNELVLRITQHNSSFHVTTVG